MKGILEKARVMSVSAMALLVMALSGTALYAQGSTFQAVEVQFTPLIDVSSAVSALMSPLGGLLASLVALAMAIAIAWLLPRYTRKATN